MSDQVIIIPSRGRPDIIKQRTLKLINGTDNVYVVVEPQDYNLYKQALENYDVRLLKLPYDNRGLTYARRYIQGYFKKIKYVWQLDDNLDQLLIRNGLTEGGHPHLDKIEWLDITAQQVFDETLALMKEKGYIQMTLSFRPSNWYFEGELKENNRAWGIVLNDNEKMIENGIFYDLNCLLFQDLDIVAQIMQKGFKNATYHKYAFHKRMAGYKSGCSDYRTKELADKVCDYLEEKYGNDISIKFNKRHNINEPQFKWNKLINNDHKLKEKKVIEKNIE